MLFGTVQGIIILHSGPCQGPSGAELGLKVQVQWQAWQKAKSRSITAGRVGQKGGLACQPCLGSAARRAMSDFYGIGLGLFWLPGPARNT